MVSKAVNFFTLLLINDTLLHWKLGLNHKGTRREFKKRRRMMPKITGSIESPYSHDPNQDQAVKKGKKKTGSSFEL